MGIVIKTQSWKKLAYYAIFGILSITLMVYYLSNTIIHFTSNQQFPISSFRRFPLTFLIFPAEIFSFCFALYFVYSLFNDRFREINLGKMQNKASVSVAVLIPVYNEPKEIVERTVAACRKISWPGPLRLYILDDSNSDADKKNMEQIARRHACQVVRRNDRVGYKAGNINNAVKNVIKEQFFVILDCDQAPEPDFLAETMDNFSDQTVSFVQTPQYFLNDKTTLERATKLGANIFYQSQCVSKSRDGAMPFCGTNVIVRTGVFRLLKGFSYYTSTEDIELGLRMNEAGYRGVFVPKVLVYGYAPVDFEAYASQQYRWSNGNLAILRESWSKIIFGNFSLRYKIHTLFTLGWWLIGIVSIIYTIVPILSLFLGGTHHTWLPTALLIILFANVVMGISMIYVSLHGRIEGEKVRFSDALIQYSLITNSMFIYAKSAVNALFGRYVGFIRTKKQRSSSGWKHIRLNILFAIVCFGFSIYALYHSAASSDFQNLRTYFPVSLWLLFYSMIFASSIFFVGNPEKPKVES